MDCAHLFVLFYMLCKPVGVLPSTFIDYLNFYLCQCLPVSTFWFSSSLLFNSASSCYCLSRLSFMFLCCSSCIRRVARQRKHVYIDCMFSSSSRLQVNRRRAVGCSEALLNLHVICLMWSSACEIWFFTHILLHLFLPCSTIIPSPSPWAG